MDNFQGTSSRFYTIDPSDGSTTVIGTTNLTGLIGLAFDPTTGLLYGSSGGNSAVKKGFFRIDTATGEATLIGPAVQYPKPLVDLTFAPDGTLYGWMAGAVGNVSSLVTIELSDGSHTLIGPGFPAPTRAAGLTFGPGGLLYSAGRVMLNGVFHTIDPLTGLSTGTIAITGGTAILEKDLHSLTYPGTGTLLYVENDNAALLTFDTATGELDFVRDGVFTLRGLAFNTGPLVVPTLTEWGVFSLILLLAAAAFVHVRKLQAA